MVSDQAASLRQLMSNRLNKKPAKTIAIFSGKGGVGKSNFAINFGLCLSKFNKKVMIIDLDIGMGNIDILLGKNPKHSIAEMLEKKLDMFDMIETVSDNLSYISAGTSLSHFFELSFDGKRHFIQEMDQIITSFDFVLLDLGAGMSKNHLAFIEAADESLVLTTPEPTSLTDCYAAMKHLLIESGNKEVNMSLVVNRTTRSDEGIEVYNRLKYAISTFLNDDIQYAGSLPDDSAVTEAVKRQIPFYELFPKAKISKQLEGFVVQYLTDETTTTARSSTNFLSKMKSIFSIK